MRDDNIKNTIIRELFTPARRNYKRSSVVVKGIDDLYQCDLVILNQFSRENSGYKYILLCINTFTKKLHAQPLKSRSSNDVTIAMRNILSETGKFNLLQVFVFYLFYHFNFISVNLD
jgi:hypothetical protein